MDSVYNLDLGPPGNFWSPACHAANGVNINPEREEVQKRMGAAGKEIPGQVLKDEWTCKGTASLPQSNGDAEVLPRNETREKISAAKKHRRPRFSPDFAGERGSPVGEQPVLLSTA